MSADDKRIKLIFIACIAIDLVAVAVIMAFVSPVIGIVVAVALLSAEFVVYLVLFRPDILQEKLPALLRQEGRAPERATEDKERETPDT